MVQLWGSAQTPFRNLGRRRSSLRFRQAGVTLLDDLLATYSPAQIRFVSRLSLTPQVGLPFGAVERGRRAGAAPAQRALRPQRPRAPRRVR